MTVFDSSALLAFLLDEPGSDLVEARLDEGGSIGAANWSEVAQKTMSVPGAWVASRDLLLSYALVVEPVLPVDAERAAAAWRRGEGLSLGDRLCLALGARLDAQILTADGAWRGRDGVALIR
jgi:ribonuclease VapC